MKKLLAILLVLTMLTPFGAFAQEAETAPELISEADYAAVDAMWETLEDAETRVMKAAADETTAQAVASAVKDNALYVEGTLRWKGDDHFTFETTVGVTCGYSARLRNIAMNAQPDAQAMAQPEVEILSYAAQNAPSSKDVYLIEPYYGIDSSFTKQYQNEAKAIAEATGGTYNLYTKTGATIDVVAEAMEKGAVVIFDSHGDTDYARGSDYTTGATTSYLLLQTGAGLTTEDYADDNGTHHAVNYGSYGSMKYYAVDGTCIANHMDEEAPHSILWAAICLGMATDGLHAPLREKGVEVAYGYSQSVTFDYDYLWEESFWDEMIAGKTVAAAISTMKSEVGKWDYCDYYTTPQQARNNDCAFPIVVSSEDVYPGHGNVDALQEVYSTWTLYRTDSCTHEQTEEQTKEPTCTENGYIKTVCLSCGEVLSEESTDSLGHDYMETVCAPTCTEQGYTTHTCSRCEESYVDGYVDALGHDYQCETVAPTCTEQGCDLYTCAVCGESYQENPVDALGHNYVDGVCTNCGADEIIGPQPCPCEQFSDVNTESWFHDAVVYSVEKGLMNGIGDGLFAPEGDVTRAMLVTILYRNEGTPEVSELSNPFEDVLAEQWYTDAIVWAADNGIVMGMSETTFAPDAAITREQIATILYRYSGTPEIPTMELEFPDADKISAYALDAMSWAVSEGIINGMDGQLAPLATATRAQLAAMLMRYLEA